MDNPTPVLVGPKVDPTKYEIGTVITTDGKNYYLDPECQLAGAHFISVEGHDGPTWDSFHVGLGYRVYRYLRAEDIPTSFCPSCGQPIIQPPA
jgi:hypothetical protein